MPRIRNHTKHIATNVQREHFPNWARGARDDVAAGCRQVTRPTQPANDIAILPDHRLPILLTQSNPPHDQVIAEVFMVVRLRQTPVAVAIVVNEAKIVVGNMV